MLQTRKKRWNLGKKLSAVLLSAAMAVTGCVGAFAQEDAAPAAQSKSLSNLSIVTNGQTIDLSGLNFELDTIEGETEDDGAVCLHLDVDGQSVVKVGITQADGLYVYHLEGPSLGVKDYVIDPTVALAKSLDQGISTLVGILQSVDTKALAESIMKLGEAKPAEEETEAQTEAQTEEIPDVTVEGDVDSLFEKYVVDSENVQLSGSVQGANGELTVAEGTYNTRELTLDTDAICEILDMVRVDGEATSASQELRDAGAEVLLHITVVKGVTDDLNRVVSMEMLYNAGEEAFDVDLDVNKGASENGETADVIFNGLINGEQAGLSFTVASGVHEGESFSMDDVDMANAVVLTELNDEAENNEIDSAVSALGMDLLGTVLSPVMETMMADADMSALEAATEAAE